MPLDSLTPLLVATSFAAGLNLYATVATLGLLGRLNLITLPPKLSLLTSWYVIGPCVLLFLVELVADKIPLFDLLWNALHTFVRVPIAALLAYEATAQLSPGMQLVSALLGGLIALAAHSGKTAVRAAVTASPEPFSNIILSLGEDALAICLTWLAAAHPYWAAAIVLISLAAIGAALRFVVRALRNLIRSAERALGI